MDAILLFSHGSVLCGAEANLLDLARSMERDGEASIVEVGFLNYSAPRFEDAVRRCVARGARRIAIAPYFLVSGKFVTDDLPPRIAAARREFPEVDLVVGDAVRDHPAIPEALLSCAGRARPPAEWRELAARQAAEFCRDDPRCPLHGTPSCPRSPGGKEPR